MKYMDLSEIRPHEIIDEDIENWIRTNEEDEEGNKISRTRLYEFLCSRLGVGYRHLMRYKSGEYQMPLNKIIPFCKIIGATRLVKYLAFEAGLETCDEPELSEMDSYDAAAELVDELKTFSDQATVLCNAMQNTPDADTYRAVKRNSRMAREQMLRCEKLYEAALRAHSERRNRGKRKRKKEVRKALEAQGQLRLFGEDDG